MKRPSGLSIMLILMTLKSCIIFVVLYQSYKLLIQPYLLNIKLYGRNNLLEFVIEYTTFSSILIITDIITFLLLLGSNYELIKYFLIITLLCQLIILFPFSTSGIILAFTASHASAKAFSSIWLDKFHYIHYYSSNLTAPKFNTTKIIDNNSTDLNLTMQQLNASNLIDDIIGVRDMIENESIIKKLDKYLRFINSFQRQLECCGVEGSHEWLSLYSGTFEHHKMTKYDLWWSNSWLPKRFTSSCCSAKNFLCSIYQEEQNGTIEQFYKNEIIGCRKKVITEITKNIKILCSFLIGTIFVQLIISLFNELITLTDFMLIFNCRWKRRLEITLQQQKKDASNNKDDYLPKIKEEIIEEERNK
ncbi:Ribosome maturation factor RimM [Dirofilaria immitis]